MRVVPVRRDHPEASSIEEAARLLSAGELVAFPTETVYGLGAVLRREPLLRIFEAKGRPTHHPLIVHVASLSEAETLATHIPPAARRLAAAFWPGPLTLVLSRAPHVPDAVASGLATIAVRVPSHPVALSLVKAAGPLAAPSANPYQSLSPTRAEHVVRGLGERVAMILDAGPCDAGIESTVIDLTGTPQVLRLGALPCAQVRALVPELSMGHADPADDDARASPGMGEKHYAPRVPLCVMRTPQHFQNGAARAGFVVFEPLVGVPHVRVLPRDPARYGHELYAALHALEAEGVDAIVVEAVPETDAWAAIRDRLRRASSGGP